VSEANCNLGASLWLEPDWYRSKLCRAACSPESSELSKQQREWNCEKENEQKTFTQYSLKVVGGYYKNFPHERKSRPVS
jgi:hypothetical protein